MIEYITKHDVKQLLFFVSRMKSEEAKAALEEVAALVSTAPAVDVRPVVKARWEKVMDQPYFRKHYHVVACSACHKRGNQGWYFCPFCGAKMIGGDDDV